MSKETITLYYDDLMCAEAPRNGVNYGKPVRMFESPYVVVLVSRRKGARIDFARLGYAAQIAVTNAGLPITGLVDVAKRERKPTAPKHVRESRKHMGKLL